MLFAKTNVLILLNLKKYIPNVVFREIFQILFCRHRNCICLEVKLHFAVQADLEQVQEVQDADLHQHAQPDLQVPKVTSPYCVNNCKVHPHTVCIPLITKFKILGRVRNLSFKSCEEAAPTFQSKVVGRVTPPPPK